MKFAHMRAIGLIFEPMTICFQIHIYLPSSQAPIITQHQSFKAQKRDKELIVLKWVHMREGVGIADRTQAVHNFA